MAGEMITSLKALLSPQMAKYVGSSCSQQLGGTGAGGRLRVGGSLAWLRPPGPWAPCSASPGPQPQSLHSLPPAGGLDHTCPALSKAWLTSLLLPEGGVRPRPLQEQEEGEVCYCWPIPLSPLIPTPAHECCQLIPEGMAHN